MAMFRDEESGIDVEVVMEGGKPVVRIWTGERCMDAKGWVHLKVLVNNSQILCDLPHQAADGWPGSSITDVDEEGFPVDNFHHNDLGWEED